VLAVIYLAVGGLFLCAAVFLGLGTGLAAGIVGASANRDDAVIAIPILGIAGTALAVFLGLFALPSLITGYGLLNYRPWARIAGIILSAIGLVIIFPISTIVGVYGLYVLLNKETERLFNSPVVV